jgi:UDP-N-acetylglucosamine/UDP-N-acetylgalactosamine diphosphorylase
MNETRRKNIKIFLHKNQQFDLINCIDEVAESSREQILEQVDLFACDFANGVPVPEGQPGQKDFSLLNACDSLRNAPDGTSLLANGKVSTLVLAGGAGSRLKTLHPKGCYPISPIKQKSLFQLMIERTIAAEKLYGAELRIGFLVSQSGQPLILEFLKRNDFFGHSPEKIDILPQSCLPYYNQDNQWFLSSESRIAQGANGNGDILNTIQKNGYLEFLEKKGIEQLTVVPIDNPLADPFHHRLIGSHAEKEADISLLCFQRQAKENLVGLLIERNNKIGIVDYSAIDGNKRDALGFANLNIFSFSLPFLKRASQEFDLPLHWVEKRALSYDPKDDKEHSIVIRKGETFITDLAEMADHVNPLLVNRDDYFAALKSTDGVGSVAEVQTKLYKRNQAIIKEITGIATVKNFELSMDFYYPTKELLAKWKGKALPVNKYITPDL